MVWISNRWAVYVWEMEQSSKLLIRRLCDESGQDLVEYALILAMVVLVAISWLHSLANVIANVPDTLLNQFYNAFNSYNMRLMDEFRAAQLTCLRLQVRSFKQRERRLLLLHDKPCGGNRVEAAAELVRARRHIQEARTALADALSGPAVST